MAARYVVIGSFINAKVMTLTGPTVVGFYKDAILPAEADEAHLKHLLAKGLVAEVEESAEADEPEVEESKERSVKEILADVGDDPEKAAEALSAELEKGDGVRTSLVEPLRKLLAPKA